MAFSKDNLLYSLLNLTGRKVILLDKKGTVRLTLEPVGNVTFQNTSVPIAREFHGLPTFEFRMIPYSGLPPEPPDLSKNPAYVLVNNFIALGLAATRCGRKDVMTMVSYREDSLTKDYIVTALGHVPCR